MNLTCYKYEKNSRAFWRRERAAACFARSADLRAAADLTLVEPMLAPRKMTPMFVP